MKVLLITGLLAKDTVKHFTRESHVKTKILALKVPVAALLTLEQIAKSLENLKCNDFDVILVPGLIRGDATIITDTVGTTTFKGPRYAADLPTVLNALRKTELSTVTPACDILREELQKKALRELDVVEENRELLLKNPNNVLIGELPVGRDFPMRIMAEIVDAPLLPKEEIQRLAINYVRLGADIIDVGMIAGESNPLEAKRAVEVVKRIVNVPVSIDTLDPDEIKEAVSVGADMILSADAGNIEMIAPFASDTAVVVIPTNQREGHFLKKAEERVNFLEQIIKKAQTLGITKCVGDLILDPANALESLIAFREFGDRNPSIPLFLGVSNITELIDADSVGVNALLARLAAEIGVSILLATEKSDKAKGSVREEVIAAKMMFLAKKRGSVPKDLGIHLLMLKDKKIREEPYREEVEGKTRVTIAAGKPQATILDANGLFKIAVDRKEENIVALHFATPQDDKPLNIIKGKTAEHIYAKIVEMSLITQLDHAAYLGNELSKAEIALTTGKEYIQDSPLFKKLLSF